MPSPTDEVKARFSAQPVDEQKIAVICAIRKQFSALAVSLVELVPNCRERALALTHLEDADMWMAKAITANGLSEAAEKMFADGGSGVPATLPDDPTNRNGIQTTPPTAEVSEEQAERKRRLMQDNG